MNKLMGFYALEKSGLPAVPWKKYNDSIEFDDNILWTIRTAVLFGDDLNLPRKVGVTAKEAKSFAEELTRTLSKDDLIIYYPYFIADKSGVIDVASNRVVIEAVKEDLWNLVTHNKRDVTVTYDWNSYIFNGKEDFLYQDELFELTKYSEKVKRGFRDEISEGKSILLEWSYAYKSNLNKKPIGEKNIVFYEIRTV